jgi:hypothetical protein
VGGDMEKFLARETNQEGTKEAKGQRRESNKRKLIVEKMKKIRFKDETKPK